MTDGAKFTVAAVQADPVDLDLDATVSKMEGLIAEAAGGGAELVVFPETFLSGYPAWVPDVFNDDPAEHERYVGRPWFEYWHDFVGSSVTFPSDAVDRICRAARQAKVHVVTGMNEKSTPTDEQVQLFNAALVVGPDGTIIGKRRKLTPVVHEQIYHARGDSRDVRLFDTTLGRLGVAQCFENFSPLYKHALASMGEQIHCALWFALEATGPWLEAAARLHAIESGSWVVVAVQYNHPPGDDAPEPARNWRSHGGSVIVSPLGEFVAGPVYGEEAILYAEVDPGARRAVKAAWDPVGRDGRPDVFRFAVEPPLPTTAIQPNQPIQPMQPTEER